MAGEVSLIEDALQPVNWSYGAYRRSEAGTRLDELMDRVERGESVTITRNGMAVAELIPVPVAQSRDHAEVIAELLDSARAGGLAI